MKKYEVRITVYNSEAEKFFPHFEVVEARDSNEARLKGQEAIERLKKANPARHCVLKEIKPLKK